MQLKIKNCENIYIMDGNEYDINQYTDEECYNILELNNPSDRELEMKILQNMDSYESKSKRLHKFFESMYDRFFGGNDDEDDEVEGFTGGFQDATGRDVSGVGIITPKTNDDEINQVNALMKSNTAGKVGTLNSGNKPKEGTVEVNQVDYVKGTLNPVERKTLFKMISIDSQYREDPNVTSATNFTMNLSEPIDNVISMKLYSVQIPYTWYTVNNAFGSNFFYIKGNSPGINNGNHDIKIDIFPGTYTGPQIVTKINEQFSALKNKSNILTTLQNNPNNTALAQQFVPVLDMSLGNTQAAYIENSSKVYFEFDLKKQYDETNYYVYFPTADIQGFLGYNSNTYYPFTAYSGILPNTINNLQNEKFTLDSSSNYFTVQRYIGTTVLQDIVVKFSLQIDANWSRQELLSDLNNQLEQNPYLDSTYSTLVWTNIADSSNSQFKLTIKLNRYNTDQIENAKLRIILPYEEPGKRHIWTGSDSCFVFPEPSPVNEDKVIELNEILSETPTSVTNYRIDTSQNIIIQSTKPNFDVSYTANVPQSDPATSGYLLAEYRTAINSALRTMNDATKRVYNVTTGDFNISSTVANTNFDIISSAQSNRPQFQFDIAREFTQSSYYVYFGNSGFESFFKILGFDYSYNNLTDLDYTITITRTAFTGITINSTNNFMKIISKPGSNIDASYNLTFNTAAFNNGVLPVTINSLSDLRTIINTAFAQFTDADGEQVLKGCFFTYDTVNNQLQLSLTVRVSKILTEKDFKVTLDGTSWSTNLKFTDTSYNLNDPNYNNGTTSIFKASVDISGTKLTINALNNTVLIKPYADGVMSSDGANDIVLTIPNGDYTLDALIATLQQLLQANTETAGSTIAVEGLYTRIKLTVNKLYTAKDYKLVFYDTTSYISCVAGVAQNINWDSTLGWLIGYHTYPEYALGDFFNITEGSLATDNYKNNVYTDIIKGYTNSVNGSKVAIIGDTVLNPYMFNYFLVVLDDFIQNHVNAGLITITSLENDVALPSYAVRASYQCDPVTGVKTAVSASNKLNTNLNSKQLYAMNQIVEAKRAKSKNYVSGPYLKDVFALIPMKLTGMTFGQTYMEFGGTLQNQDRKYFGPVRIQKLSVKLMNDKGAVVNLNGSNWSFCIICEILNKQT